MLREKTANSPLLLIRRALQLFALAASEKEAKLHSEKANTRTKGNISSHPFRGSFAALSRRSSLTKGAIRGCAKSRIKSRGEMLNFPRLFSFSLRFFQRTMPFINRFLEKVTPNTYGNNANTLAIETASDRDSTQNTRRHDQSMPVLRTADRQTCVCLPPSLRFVRAQKKQLSIFRWIAV